MTPKQEAAMHQLAAALGVVEKKPIPKDMAGRVLAEALGAHAEGHHQHAHQAVHPQPAPTGTELAKLRDYLAGTHDQREPDLQRQIDEAVAKALKAHGITEADKPPGDLTEQVTKAFNEALERTTTDDEEDPDDEDPDDEEDE